MNITWNIKTFDELTKIELFNIIRLRFTIFVSEQKITEPDLDEQDLSSYHVFGTDEHSNIIAVSRFFWENNQLFIGRVAVPQHLRHEHIGSTMLAAIENYLLDTKLSDYIYLHAQLYIKDFYLSLGYEIIGQPFDEAGIEHVMMRKKIN